MLNRRHFLATAAALPALAQKPKPLDRLAVLSWSFRDAFANTRAKNGWVPDTDLDIMDYPAMIADRYDIHNVEIQTMYLKQDATFIKDLRGRLDAVKSKLVSIAAEPPTAVNEALGGDDEAGRANAVAVNKTWIDFCANIGCPILMINQGNLHENLAPLTESAKKLVEYGNTKKVTITAEPRGTSGRQPDRLIQVMKESGMKATPDMGNFADDVREKGLRDMLPFAAGTCHTRYNPTRFDLAKLMQITKDVGYKGLYTIEAGFSGDPYAQVQLVLDNILKHL